MEIDILEILIKYGKEGIFLVLFGYLFWDTRKENKAREQQHINEKLELSNQLKDSSEQIGKSIQVIEKFEKNFAIINEKIDNIQNSLKKKE